MIEEGNWMAIQESDIPIPEGGFDAVICLGNSFAHLPEFSGDQENHKIAVKNFHDVLKPGGLFFIDHRNYDAILDTGKAPQRNMYYNVNKNEIIQFKWLPAFLLLNAFTFPFVCKFVLFSYWKLITEVAF